MRERDTKYTETFDVVFKSVDCKIKKTPIKSLNLQAYVERVIQTLKHEILNSFCVVTNAHMDHTLQIAADWYNTRRGHSEREHLPPDRDSEPPVAINFKKEQVVCDELLGGHLKSYRRVP